MENEVINLASMKGSVDFSMFSMFFKSDWNVKFVIRPLVIAANGNGDYICICEIS